MIGLKYQDSEIFNVIQQEKLRQNEGLELIASENIVSKAVLEATGSILTNKYAEGYPGRRYYGGCEYVDVIEEIARRRACSLFGADYANVQPHSGSQANMAVYFSVLQPGDKIMGMDLAAGGHLTHGAKVSFSGKVFQAISYGVNKETELLDYDAIALQAEREQPKLIIAGASAYTRFIDFARFAQIAHSVGAYLLVDMAHVAGLVAAGVHPSPVQYADFVTSTTHKTLRGPRGGLILIGHNKENHSGLVTKSQRTKTLTELVDSAIFPYSQGGPLMHIIAGKAVCFAEASTPEFVDYQKQVVVNARTLGKVLQDGGLRLVAGGTDNHMCLIDLQSLGINGKDAQDALGYAGITVNKNSIPFDQLSAHLTSGIRIGTPALTTRGMKEAEMQQIGQWMLEVLRNIGSFDKQDAIRQEVKKFASCFPVVGCGE